MDETPQSEHCRCVLAAWRRMSQHCNPRSAATTWRSCHRCQSQDTAQMDETRQSKHCHCVLAAWIRMSQHRNPLSATTAWRSYHRYQSQDTEQMDETPHRKHYRCALQVWRRMSQHDPSSPQNASVTKRRSRVSARASQRVHFESGSASALAARLNDLCTLPRSAVGNRCSRITQLNAALGSALHGDALGLRNDQR